MGWYNNNNYKKINLISYLLMVCDCQGLTFEVGLIYDGCCYVMTEKYLN